jgi:phenylacetate-CoA ligase
MINYPETAYQPMDEIKIMQEKKLQELIQFVGKYSPFYKQVFASNNINPLDIKTLNDLKKIPTTSKEHLQQRNNDFLCVPRNKIIEYSSTSGTLGSPVTIALTENDLNRLAYNEYSSFLCADGSPNDIYQLMLTLDRQFMAGMAYYSGIRKIGAGIIRLGPGVPSLQWETILRLQPTAIVAVPSFLIKLIQFANEHHIDVNKTSVKKAVCIGENIRNTDFSYNILGKKITEAWNIKLYSTYASTEMQTAFTECIAFNGGHLQSELLILEVLDENDLPVAAGQAGEVTITTLGVEGMPLLRYKTGDICMYFDDPCVDMLTEMEDVLDFVAEVYSNEMGTDEVLIYILPAHLTDECDRKIRANLQARLRVSPHVTYITAEEMKKMQAPESGRKIVKFIDKRRNF